MFHAPARDRQVTIVKKRESAFVVAAAGLYWLGLWNALRIDWQTNDLYSFGWSVPVVAVCLFILRWRRRPAPVPPGTRARMFTCILVSALALLEIPLRLLEGANAEWRLLFWCRETQCVLITLCFLGLTGGRKWVRHFCIPVLFTATAVPWPVFAEVALVQSLMRAVATLTTEALFWSGIPATTSGNLIQLAGGVVGVGEACSGMRTIQSSLMLALLAGELFRLSAIRRTAVVASGIVAAFLLNIARTFAMGLLASTRGFEATKSWHDLLGTAEATGTLAAVFAIAWLLRGAKKIEPGDARANVSGIPAPIMPRWPVVLALIAWLAAAAAANGWYHRAGNGLGNNARFQRWTIRVPARPAAEFKRLTASGLSWDQRAQLRTNDGISIAWEEENGTAWNLVFLQWPQGRSSGAVVTSHHPDVCLPAAGYEFDREDRVVKIIVKGIPMLFHHYLFNSRTGQVHVFYQLSDLRGAGFENLESDLSLKERLRTAWKGLRSDRCAILEIVVKQAESGEAAVNALPGILDKLVELRADFRSPQTTTQ